MTEFNSNLSSESQRDRWIKYGTNVAIASVVVIALAAGVVYLAQRFSKHVDTTAAGSYSLKPQTINLIGNNKQKIKIVNLYTRSQPPKEDQSGSTAGPTQVDLDAQATAVDDLLDEYRSRGKNISIESIDPVKEPKKVDALITEVSSQFSGQVEAYKKYIEDLKPIYQTIEKQAEGEVEKIQALPSLDLKTDAANESFYLVFQSVPRLPAILKKAESEYRKKLRDRIPDYKAVTDDVDRNMSGLSTVLGLIIDGFKKTEADKAVPDAYRKYVTNNLATYVSMKAQIDGLVTREQGLGELKLDTLKSALAQRNPILVRGETAWKVVPYDQVWLTDVRDNRNTTEETPIKSRFAGEQAVSTSILALQEPIKPKVCFIREGSQPVASDGGIFTTLGDRLRAYNYDVTDKDLTGQYASMMAQYQGPVSEPSNDEIVDAIWVVLAQKAENRQNPMASQQGIGPAVADHIAHGFHYVNGVRTPGGVAMILTGNQGDPLTEALTPLGISVNNQVVCVHAPNTEGQNSPDDINNIARSIPIAFYVDDWGTHPITSPLRSLPGVIIVPAVLRSEKTPGIGVTPLIPLTSEMPIWGETDQRSIRDPKFDKDADITGSFNAAYAVEDPKAGSRVVVCSSPESFIGVGDPRSGAVTDIPDPNLRKQGIYAPAFPGNNEFFMNSIYWLGHRESMIAMSPAAMTVDRVGPISNGVLGFWHIGVLLLGIPGLAVAGGAAVFFARRS